jgi:hypothetical protein
MLLGLVDLPVLAIVAWYLPVWERRFLPPGPELSERAARAVLYAVLALFGWILGCALTWVTGRALIVMAAGLFSGVVFAGVASVRNISVQK